LKIYCGRGAVHLAKHKHPHRIKETSKILEDILSLEEEKIPYHGTFIFDREDDPDNNQPTFDELKIDCISRIKKLMLA
jgi:hypothetical protein